MPFDCKTQHHKCKASCCSIVPFSNERWERNQHKIITKPERIIESLGPAKITDKNGDCELEGDMVPETKTGKCCFLNEDLSCNIYEDRPEVCRKFGTESHLMMKCGFMDKNGRTRSRQESRYIDRAQRKWTDGLMNRFKIFQS